MKRLVLDTLLTHFDHTTDLETRAAAHEGKSVSNISINISHLACRIQHKLNLEADAVLALVVNTCSSNAVLIKK